MNTKLKVYELPDGKMSRPEVQITSPLTRHTAHNESAKAAAGTPCAWICILRDLDEMCPRPHWLSKSTAIRGNYGGHDSFRTSAPTSG